MEQITTRRQDLEGELLPPDDTPRALMPVNGSAPLIRIRLPEAHEETATGSLEHERRRPVRAPSLEADVTVPGLQALITALALGLCAALLAWALGWSWRAVAVACGLALAGAWLWRLRLVDSLLWEIETLTGRDIDHDGAVGRPSESGPVLVNPWQARQEVAQARADDGAQAERAALVAFVHRCYTAGCSESAHGVKASGPDREAYVKRRDVLLALGVAAWRNPERPRAGWRVVVSHQKAMELIGKHTL